MICIVCQSEQKVYFTYHNFTYYRCPHCSHVTTTPYPTKKQIVEHYKRKFRAGNYSLLRTYAEDYNKIYEVFADELEKSFPTIKSKKILDIGCFTGEFLEILQQRGADVYGLELQKEAVAIANKKLGKRVFQADVMSDDFPQIKFDAITLIGLVEHVTDPIMLLKRCHQLLKKDGVIFIQTPNSGSLLSRTMKRLWPPFAPVEHIHLFSRKSLTRSLEHTQYSQIRFHQSWKKLPFSYIYHMLENFGQEFHRLLRPISPLIVRIPAFPVYIGEMVMLAKKK